MPVLEAGHVVVFGDAVAHARLDAHAGGIGVRGFVEGMCVQGIIVAAFERISAHGFHLGRRDVGRSRVPDTEIFGVATAAADFRDISHAGGIAECLQHRRGIGLQAITACTSVSALSRRETVVLVFAGLLASGVCGCSVVSFVRTDEGAGSGFIEAAKINI